MSKQDLSSLLVRVFLLRPYSQGLGSRKCPCGVGSCEVCSVSVEACAREWSVAREGECARGRQQGSERERERLVRQRERRRRRGARVQLVIVCGSWRLVGIGGTCRIRQRAGA